MCWENCTKIMEKGFGVLFLHKFLGWFCLPGPAGLPVKCADPTTPKLSNHRISIEKLLCEACSRCCMDTVPAHRDSLRMLAVELLDLHFWGLFSSASESLAFKANPLGHIGLFFGCILVLDPFFP